ncbi:MAG TPA: cytochrome c peroxidase [Anaerolineae bacterium]|nr:cytochrome c peroxidase [Anaerolineae bacterium]
MDKQKELGNISVRFVSILGAIVVIGLIMVLVMSGRGGTTGEGGENVVARESETDVATAMPKETVTPAVKSLTAELDVPTLLRQLEQQLEEAGVGPVEPVAEIDEAKLALGQVLYFDKELSGNRDISCATCHHPTLASGDGRSLSLGTGAVGLGEQRQLGYGRSLIPRHAPDVFNRGDSRWDTMFWDGRINGHVETGFDNPANEELLPGLDNILAVQAMFPVTSRDEMRGDLGDSDIYGQRNELADFYNDDWQKMWTAIMKRLLAIPEYQEMFAAAYPDVPQEELTFVHAANAIAAFEIDAFTFTDSPWDEYLAGDGNALTEEQVRGAWLFFGPAGCAGCHNGPLLTDQQFYNLGVPQLGPGKGNPDGFDFGRFLETEMVEDQYRFRTPPLRNVTETGPWMHNGAYSTLEGVIRHHLDPVNSLLNYEASELERLVQLSFDPYRDMVLLTTADVEPTLLNQKPLSEEDIAYIIAFLESLTSPSLDRLEGTLPESVPSGLPITD